MQDFKRLLKYLRPHWLTFFFALIAMIIGGLFETAVGALLVPIIKQFAPQMMEKSTTLFGLETLIPTEDWFLAWLTISGLLIAFTILGGIADYFSAYLMAKIGQSAVLNLRQELYEHLLQQPASFFEKHRTNYLVSRLVNSCAAMELAVSANMRDVLRESFALVMFLGAGFYFSWRLMLGALIIAPIIALF